jgi:hypothetical protein
MHSSRRSFLLGCASSLASDAGVAQPVRSDAPVSDKGEQVLKTLTVQNASGNATTANSHTPTIGLLFRKGDVPSGTYPVLKTSGGADVPCTFWNKTTWSDGSIKFIGCLPRFPDAVGGRSTASLKVHNGGLAPVASSRTLNELYAANISVVGNAGLDNISGTWTCALSAQNVIETVVIGDGPAGKLWRLLCNFSQSGSPHGQLVCYFYIMALQDVSGNLAGFRILPRVTQPYYNYDAPAKNFRSFTSLQLHCESGPTVFDPIANSYSAKAFAWSGSGNAINAIAHGYDSGVAVRVTTTGTLPIGLAANTTYWVSVNNANQLILCDGSMVGALNNGTNQVKVTGDGSGTHTMTPIPYLSHFGTAWLATKEGKYVYVQGGGSVASEPTLRVQADKAYDHATRVLPPYDMSLGTVSSNASYYWAPQCVGALALYIGTTGERDDIGPLSSFHARHFHTQTAVDERVTRIIGLAQGHLCSHFREHASHAPINLSQNAYAGLPPSMASTFTWSPLGSRVTGFTAPPGPSRTWVQLFSGPDLSHQTQYSAYPYIMTGEPQYSDLLLECANMALGMFSQEEKNFTIGSKRYYGIGPAGKDSIRTGAWVYRDIIWSAILAPDKNPDGTASTQYLKDLAVHQSAYLVDWNSQQSPWWKANGFWYPQNCANGRASSQIGYLWSAMLLHAMGLEDANALAMVTHMSLWPAHVKAITGNLWSLASYYEISSSIKNQNGAPFISSDAEWGPWVNVGNLSWTNAGSLFTWTAPNWTPANGDKIIFWALNVPAGLSLKTAYYAVNTSGDGFQLSATPGGAPITILSAGDLRGFATPQSCYPQFATTIIPANPPSSGYVHGYVAPSSYGANQLGDINWSLAAGINTPGLSACSAELIRRQAGVNYAQDPKWAMQAKF